MGFVGAGNQITERGLLLRLLIPEEPSHAFLSGKPSTWNPFVLSGSEKLFFFYHLCDIDQVTPEIILRLGDRDPGTTLESSAAAEVTCRSLFDVLAHAKSNLNPRDLPALRTARELACTIAKELDLADLLDSCARISPRVPKPRTSTARTASNSRRRTTKNADHQTIPRFEQLVDIGFLAKPAGPDDLSASYKTLAQRRWRYQPTERCHLWRDAAAGFSPTQSRWLWKGFAAAAVRSGLSNTTAKAERPNATRTVRFLADAYALVRRPIGHTPFESVALLAMIGAAREGYVLEMATLHDLLLAVKKRNLLPDLVFFASGNELDKMFVLFKQGFDRDLPDIYEQLHMPPRC